MNGIGNGFAEYKALSDRYAAQDIEGMYEESARNAGLYHRLVVARNEADGQAPEADPFPTYLCGRRGRAPGRRAWLNSSSGRAIRCSLFTTHRSTRYGRMGFLTRNTKPVIIRVNEQISLSQVGKDDEEALVRWLNDPDIRRNTLRIPFPYQREHAKEFIRHVQAVKKEYGYLTEWAIRNGEGLLIGGIGFSRVYGKHSHKDEMGYWLGAPFRGMGIMTGVVAKICEVGFAEYKLLRIEAPVFAFNTASGRVLEKNGFVAEGVLRNYFLKNDKPVDVKMYAKIKPDA